MPQEPPEGAQPTGAAETPFDNNIVLDFTTTAQNGDKTATTKMSICQGTLREAIRQNLLTQGFPSMEGTLTEDFTAGEAGVSYTVSPQSTMGGAGARPSGPIAPGAPVSTAMDSPQVPPVPKATADTGDSKAAAGDIFDNPEKVIEQFLKRFQLRWKVLGKVNPDTGEFEIEGFVAPGDEAEQIVLTPRATAASGKPAGDGGQIVVSLATGQNLVQTGEEAPVLTEVNARPIATQSAAGAGNIVISNYTKTGDVKFNGIFNAIGFLLQLALGAQLTLVFNLGGGAGARTGSTP